MTKPYTKKYVVLATEGDPIDHATIKNPLVLFRIEIISLFCMPIGERVHCIIHNNSLCHSEKSVFVFQAKIDDILRV